MKWKVKNIVIISEVCLKAYCHENDSFSLPINLELFWISVQLSADGSTAIEIIRLDEEDV